MYTYLLYLSFSILLSQFYNLSPALKMFEKLLRIEDFLHFCFSFTETFLDSDFCLCSRVARAESVLLPVYFCCFLLFMPAFSQALLSMFLKLEARPILVYICCCRSWRERWFELRRPELSAAACI